MLSGFSRLQFATFLLIYGVGFGGLAIGSWELLKFVLRHLHFGWT